MTLTQFIEKAIEGGWTFKLPICSPGDTQWLLDGDDFSSKAMMLLDPLAWKAVGKVEGWIREDGTDVAKYYMNNPKRTPYPKWLYEMHRMIDALAEGRSIEQYLETL